MGRVANLRFRQARERILEHSAGILDDTTEALLTEANRTVPIDDAILEGSGFVATDPKRLVSVVAYDTPYAVRQHEDTRLRHRSGRRAKWLERTFRERGRQFLKAAARARGQAR